MSEAILSRSGVERPSSPEPIFICCMRVVKGSPAYSSSLMLGLRLLERAAVPTDASLRTCTVGEMSCPKVGEPKFSERLETAMFSRGGGVETVSGLPRRFACAIGSRAWSASSVASRASCCRLLRLPSSPPDTSRTSSGVRSSECGAGWPCAESCLTSI